jgi:hypothetical protein
MLYNKKITELSKKCGVEGNREPVKAIKTP